MTQGFSLLEMGMRREMDISMRRRAEHPMQHLPGHTSEKDLHLPFHWHSYLKRQVITHTPEASLQTKSQASK